MAEIIIEERKGLFVEMRCTGCNAVSTILTDDHVTAIQAKKEFQKRHRKCKGKQ